MNYQDDIERLKSRLRSAECNISASYERDTRMAQDISSLRQENASLRSELQELRTLIENQNRSDD